jgi:RHS repeat-associated protein
LGRRVEKVAGGLTTSYLYDRLSTLRQAKGTAILRYVNGRGIDQPLASDDGVGLNYFHADGLGSLIKSTSSAGAVLLTRQYDSWGNIQSGGEAAGVAFTGREWDAETSLHYYRFRYLDSVTGRFVTQDPLGFLAGPNFYAYVANRPTLHTDPLGLLPVQLCPGGPVNSQGERTTQGAGLCCRSGQYVLCTDPNWWNQATERYQYCTQKHEEYHVWQRRDDPKPCGGECSGDPCTIQSHPSGQGLRRECAAWWISYLCFRGSGERDPTDGALWEAVAWRIVKGCRKNGYLD